MISSEFADLWHCLSECLNRLGRASDPHAVLALQPAAEAFFLVHAVNADKKDEKDDKDGQHAQITDPDTIKLLEFAGKELSLFINGKGIFILKDDFEWDLC